MARKRGKELNTRLALLESAWQLFQQKGYEGTSVDAIAARAGLSKGTFFHYFPAKLSLLEAVCEHVVESAFSALSPQLEAPRLGARKRLNRLLAAMRTWRLAHAGTLVDLWRVLIRDENAALRLKLTAVADACVKPLLVEILARGNDEGVFSVEDVEQTASLVLAMINSAGAENLSALAAGKAGDQIGLWLKRRSDIVATAIERVLGARPGTLDRVNLNSLSFPECDN